ncbi:MAG: TauD/TfdA family dioxygenase, partial [SAR324 cluster bacterium]|nr:TauD/TfdA family dioxygenase [SAR324 cluster bacterium]
MGKISETLGYETEFSKSGILESKSIDQIKELLKNYHLLVIKGVHFSIEEFKYFSSLMGEIIPHDILRYRHPAHEMLSYVTNVDSEGKLDKYGATIRASDWHTDG